MKLLKVISDKDLRVRNEHYKKFEEYILGIAYKEFGYISKFETGYGWRQSAFKLLNQGTITMDFYNRLFYWFEVEFTLNQKIHGKDWECYCNLDKEINHKLQILEHRIQGKKQGGLNFSSLLSKFSKFINY